MTQTIWHTCREYQSGCSLKSPRFSAKLKLFIYFPRNFAWPFFVIRAPFLSASRQINILSHLLPLNLWIKLLHFKLMNSPPLSASFYASEWHKIDALQNGVITFRWETFLSMHLYPVHLWLQYLFGVKLSYHDTYFDSSVWSKSLPFPHTGWGPTWELQNLQVAGHIKPRSTGDYTTRIPLFLLTPRYMTWWEKLQALRIVNLLLSRWLSSGMGPFLRKLCLKV